MKKYLLLLCLVAGFAAHGQTDTSEQATPKNSDTVYYKVERMPSVTPMGAVAIRNVRYPKQAMEQGIEGTVLIGFTVNQDSSITDVKVLKGIGGGCDEEAMRVIKSIHHWIPGYQNGKAVKVYFSVPMRFKLN